MYTVEVCQNWCKTRVYTLLLRITNRKYYMASCWFVPFPMTLNDLGGHSPVARLFKCNSTNIYATSCTVSTDTLRRAVPQRQQSFSYRRGFKPHIEQISLQFLARSCQHAPVESGNFLRDRVHSDSRSCRNSYTGCTNKPVYFEQIYIFWNFGHMKKVKISQQSLLS